MKYLAAALVVVLGLGILSVSFLTKKNPSGYGEPMANDSSSMNQRLPSYTLQEITKHNTINNCWMVIHDQVYDVTTFISGHPGGAAILEGCGKDATVLFETRPMGSGTPHSGKARELGKNYVIGTPSQ